MADWYGSREQLMSLHGLDTAMLGYGMGAAAFPPIQPDAYSHAHAAAAAAYNLQRQQQSNTFSPSCFGGEQQWRHGPDGGVMEVRKEKSRDAARSRRGKENYEFYELAKMLPLPGAITSQLDKASIIRLTISYLKLMDFTLHGDPPWIRHLSQLKSHKGGALRHRGQNLTVDLFENHQGTHILQALDGFAFNLAADGRFLYIAETVSIYLGLSQVELTGSSVFDYIHAEDHQEMADQLCLTLSAGQPMPSPSSVHSDETNPNTQGTMNPDVYTAMTLSKTARFKGYERSFCIRMKSTLTKRGCHFKSSGYRVVLIIGHLRPQYVFSHNRKTPPVIIGFVALAIALPPPSVHEVRLESDMFVTRLNFNFSIAHCEPRVSQLLDYTPEEFQGRSLYSLCHGEDVDKVKKAHNDLIKKGQVMSPYFRILNKKGGYTWMQICATIICNTKNGDEQNIICVNYVLSNCQYQNVVLDEVQMMDTCPCPVPDFKTDVDNYSNVATPESTGDLSRSRGDDVSVVSPTAKNSVSIPTPNVNSPVPIHLNNTAADSQVEGTLIKTETPGTQLLPISNIDMKNNNSLSSPTGRMSAPVVANLSPTPTNRLSTPTNRLSDIVNNNAIPLTPRLDNLNAVGGENTVQSLENIRDLGSVRNLEAAMTRHLPEDTSDFSTDTLLRDTSSLEQSHRPTIQWVGGTSGQQTALPASTLLRQLYANRESVIRTSVQRSYYPEVQSTLPTPPGHDSYQENMYQKTHDYNYNSNPASTSSAIGMSSAYTEYNSAMTPPSSVSPREKMASDCNNDLRTSNYITENGGIPAQPLPLKPQVYSYPSLEPPSYTSSIGDQSSSLYPHSSFHIYHSNASKTPGPYDALRSSTSWYAPS